MFFALAGGNFLFGVTSKRFPLHTSSLSQEVMTIQSVFTNQEILFFSGFAQKEIYDRQKGDLSLGS